MRTMALKAGHRKGRIRRGSKSGSRYQFLSKRRSASGQFSVIISPLAYLHVEISSEFVINRNGQASRFGRQLIANASSSILRKY